jgi:sugar lactone lactonase YvrE
VTAWSAAPGLLSEGPQWHGERQELLWVDILGGKLHRGTVCADGAIERVQTVTVDRHVRSARPNG